MSKKLIALFVLAVISVSIAGCSETTGDGGVTTIPLVYMECTTALCKQDITPTVFALITTSGCTSPLFGALRGVSTTSINCTVAGGCNGYLSGWIDHTGQPNNSIPEGTYSICVIVDYNGDNDGSGTPMSGDSYGTLEDTKFIDSSPTQIITSFSDVP